MINNIPNTVNTIVLFILLNLKLPKKRPILADNNIIGWKANNSNGAKTISVSWDNGTTWNNG